VTASTARRLLEVLLLRASLVALPFLIWFGWRAWARSTGRDVAAAPWMWLLAIGAVLAGLSLMATAVFHEDNSRDRYIPAEAQPGGAVTPGHFEKEGASRRP
jgi:hypothetical protein